MPTSKIIVVELAPLAVLPSPLPVEVVELDELVDVESSVVPELVVAAGAEVIDVSNPDDATGLGPWQATNMHMQASRLDHMPGR